MGAGNHAEAAGRTRTLAKMREVEAEFGEPFWDVIQGCADMGLSKSVTADVVDYDRSAFLRLLRKHGQHIRWHDYADLAVWKERYYPPDWRQKISEARRASGKRCRQVVVDGVVMLQRDYAVMMGISESEAYKRRLSGEIKEVGSERKESTDDGRVAVPARTVAAYCQRYRRDGLQDSSWEEGAAQRADRRSRAGQRRRQRTARRCC